jgi:hypothetical protein
MRREANNPHVLHGQGQSKVREGHSELPNLVNLPYLQGPVTGHPYVDFVCCLSLRAMLQQNGVIQP